MKKSRFTDSQIMDAIKRSEAGIPVTDICRELGVSTPAFYRWKAKYSGMDVSLMSRMKVAFPRSSRHVLLSTMNRRSRNEENSIYGRV